MLRSVMKMIDKRQVIQGVELPCDLTSPFQQEGTNNVVEP